MMATIKEIIAMCKAGDVGEAYEIAKRDFMEWPQNIWVQRGLGWVLFYKIKNCAELRKKEELYNHFRELSELDLLTPQTDAYIFDNVLWKIAEYIKDIVNKEYVEDVERFYLLICKYKFPPSKPYSYLLKSYIKYETWSKMVDFLEWWNIENLLPEDYESFQMDNGRKIMSLAEQVYIAYSKALLKLNNKEKIQLFLPKIERLMDEYPEMVYPGYFCGKLMLVMGAERNEALNIVMPFVRKKKADFWVWQLIGDIYNDDSEMQLSCISELHIVVQKKNFWEN